MSTALDKAKREIASRLEWLRRRLQENPRLRHVLCGLVAHQTVYRGVMAILISLGMPPWCAEFVALVSTLMVAQELEEALKRKLYA